MNMLRPPRPCPPDPPSGRPPLRFGIRETAAQRRWRLELIGLTDEQIDALDVLDAAFERAQAARLDAMFGKVAT